MRNILPATLVACILLAGCKPGSAPAAGRRSVAGPATLRDVARLTGTVVPSDTLQIKSQVTQQITRIHVKEGDFVKKGQLLFDLDREQLELRHEQLSIAVSNATLGLQAAERDLQRSQSQLGNGSISADRVQDLAFARDKAKLALRSAQLDLKSNERDLYYTRIVAPRDGQLIRLNVSEGEMAVAANSISGGVLGVIADPTRLKVAVEVSELDFPRLKLGQAVEITTESQPDKLLPGTVSYIPPSAQASSSSSSVMVFKVEVALDPAAPTRDLADVVAGPRRHGHREGAGRDSSGRDHGVPGKFRGAAPREGAPAKPTNPGAAGKASTRLVPGMTVNVDFVFVERKVDVAVPYDMVSTGPDGASKLVWVHPRPDDRRPPEGSRPDAATGQLHRRKVVVGATDYRSYEILDGLVAGDTVFAAPDTGSKSARRGGPGGPP